MSVVSSAVIKTQIERAIRNPRSLKSILEQSAEPPQACTVKCCLMDWTAVCIDWSFTPPRKYSNFKLKLIYWTVWSNHITCLSYCFWSFTKAKTYSKWALTGINELHQLELIKALEKIIKSIWERRREKILILQVCSLAIPLKSH